MANKILTALVITAAVLFIAGSFWAVANQKNSVQLATYIDAQYGFELNYPVNLSPSTAFDTYYHLPNSWRSGAGPDSTGTPILSIPVFRITQEKAYPRYFDAELRIGVSSDPSEVARCYQNDQSYENGSSTDVMIGSTPFKVFQIGDAGMMQYLKGVSYRTVRDGNCFAIEQLETGSSYRDLSDATGTPDSVLESYYSSIGDIVSSFHFTN